MRNLRNHHKEACSKPSRTKNHNHTRHVGIWKPGSLFYTAIEGTGVVASAGAEELFWDCCCRALWICISCTSNEFQCVVYCSHNYLCLFFLLFFLHFLNLTLYPFTVIIIPLDFPFYEASFFYKKIRHFTAYKAQACLDVALCFNLILFH